LRIAASRRDWRALGALALGIFLSLGYFVWLFSEPRGLFEFGYAPFGPDPLPYAPMRGFTYEQLWGHVARAGLLAPGLLLLSFAWNRLGFIAVELDRRRAVLAASGTCLAVSAFCMLVILRGRAIVDDELVYRMQATFLREGRLASDLGDLTPPDVFSVPTRLGYTGKYLPGEPLVQVLGVMTGLPALLHLPLLALTLVAWRSALRLRFGDKLADYGCVALAISPTVMLTSATALSEATSLCCVAVAALGYEWARGPRPLAGAWLTACALGFGVLTRPQSIVPVGAVLAPTLLVTLMRRRAWISAAVFCGGLAWFAGLVGAYDTALGGSPLKLPWFLQCGSEHYGFGRVWPTERFEHTVRTALENLAVVLVRFNGWWLGFPCSLLVLGAWFWLPARSRRWDLWYTVGVAIIAFEFFYYSPGMSDTGSLYHFELVLPGAIVVAKVFEHLIEVAPRLTLVAAMTHFAFGTLPFVIEQSARVSRLVEAIHADSDRALAGIHEPAILFHETRGSEARPTGWVFDSFPERNRGVHDGIVTFPNLPARLRARVLVAYPGRTCWYYHRDPQTERAAVSSCEAARAQMDRAFEPDEARPLWIRPTAYIKTDFDPFGAMTRRHLRDAEGRLVPLCCALDYMQQLGARVRESAFARCISDRH
jgi:hypothetical protein